ncbi:hypothetical protein [Lysobacter humi (ex Lee et al. 2017)]
MSDPRDLRDADLAARRTRVRRTALWIAGVAVLVYVTFLLLAGLK